MKTVSLPIDYQDQYLPQDDFYRYVNKKWLDNNPVPNKYSRWGTFDILHEENLEKIKDLIKNKTNGKYTIIKQLYDEFMNQTKINNLKEQSIKKYVDMINNTKTKDDLWSVMAELNPYVANPFFNLYPEIDAKNSKLVVLYLSATGISLPERGYYFDPDKEETRNNYNDFLSKIVDLYCQFDSNLYMCRDKHIVNHIFNIETEFAKVSYTPVEHRDPDLNYNKMTIDDLTNLDNNNSNKLDWNTYIKKFIGIDAPYIILDNPNFFKRLNVLWFETSLDVLKSMVINNLIMSMTKYMDDRYVCAAFEFSKTMSGQKELKPRDERAISIINGHIGELLGELYVSHYFSEEAKQKMTEMVNNLNETLENRIKNLTWMSEETKQKALLKNQAFKAKIGYPDKFRDFSQLQFNDTNIVDMIFKNNKFNMDFELSFLFKEPDKNRWEMSAHEVNAYFHPLRNEIVFPAGILQKPFFNINNSDSCNYGGIGVVIGHEMIHSYDDKGSKYDWNGNLNNWWQEEDLKKFTEKGQYYIEEFNNSKYKGQSINGELTLGENSADLGGLKVAYQALCTKNPNLSLKEKQNFYRAYANVWKQNIHDKEADLRIRTDPHAPGEFRTNVTLRNVSTFHQVFGIKKGDKMYRENPPEIW